MTRGQATKQFGEVSEWLKEHAWKVCIRQRIGGSNPPLTAIFKEELVRKYELFSYFICLYGSELKYYTFSPLLIKQNHLIFLLSPFFILTFQQH